MTHENKVPVYYTPPGKTRLDDDFVGTFDSFEEGLAFAQTDPAFRAKHPEIKMGDKSTTIIN